MRNREQNNREELLTLFLIATATLGVAGAIVGYEQGRAAECDQLRASGIVIPTETPNPTINRRVIGRNSCGEPQYEPPAIPPFAVP